MDRFKNKYRIGSARLAGYDYGKNGAYFITICTADREPYFGEILDKKMKLNQLGELAQQYWMEIPQQFSFAKLDEYVIMPNHMHGIIIIDKTDDMAMDKTADNGKTADNRKIATFGKTAINRGSTKNVHRGLTKNHIGDIPQNHNDDMPDKNQGGFAGDKNPMFHENISRIIRWYKGRCSFEMRKIHADFAWQPRFYDHIIRHAIAYSRIANYILNNPNKWAADQFNQANQ